MTSSWRKGKPAVLCVGFDLSCHGGIASVVKSHYREWERSPKDFDYHLLKTNYCEDRPWICEPFLFLRALARLIWSLLSLNVALVHVHTSSHWSFLRKSIFVCMAHLFRKRIILHVHTNLFEEWFLSDKKILAAYIGFILRRCHLVIVLCRDWEQKLQRRYPGTPIRTLRNPSGVNTLPARRVSRSDLFTILFVGFLLPYKGIQDLLAVAQRMATEKRQDVRVVIAGKGPLQQQVLDFIRTNHLGHLVEFVGWVEGSEKDRLLSSASLFFLPSYHEGMPVAILEAISYGLPILSTRIAGIPDLVIEGQNGYLCEPGDVEGYLRIIGRLWNDRHLVEELGQRSREHSKQFAGAVVFKELESIYAEISEGQVAPRSWKGGRDLMSHEPAHATT
jgi:glycosyltransferase involved in cell wall biosynthesis